MSDAWIKALRFAALPGAAKVQLERRVGSENGTPVISYRLTSKTKSGETIGDDRDYDLLKAVMTPLEALSENEKHEEVIVELNLESGDLSKRSQ